MKRKPVKASRKAKPKTAGKAGLKKRAKTSATSPKPPKKIAFNSASNRKIKFREGPPPPAFDGNKPAEKIQDQKKPKKGSAKQKISLLDDEKPEKE